MPRPACRLSVPVGLPRDGQPRSPERARRRGPASPSPPPPRLPRGPLVRSQVRREGGGWGAPGLPLFLARQDPPQDRSAWSPGLCLLTPGAPRAGEAWEVPGGNRADKASALRVPTSGLRVGAEGPQGPSTTNLSLQLQHQRLDSATAGERPGRALRAEAPPSPTRLAPTGPQTPRGGGRETKSLLSFQEEN